MNVRKKYPRLFKVLARRLGARKAKYIVLQLDMCPDATDCYSDPTGVSGCINFIETPQGLDFWVKIQRQFDPDWG